jgi:hypothetical protein
MTPYELVITVVIKFLSTLVHGYSHVQFVFVITDSDGTMAPFLIHSLMVIAWDVVY